MIDYLNKFRLDNKIAFVFGGLGLIGRQVSIAFMMAGAKTIVLDINKKDGSIFMSEMKKMNYELSYSYFDCADIKNIEKNYSKLIIEIGCPNIFINCSYPKTDNWEENSFNKATLESYTDNVNYHLNSYVWLARLAGEAMVSDRKHGSIIQLGSIYGVVGQNLSIYEGTEMHENMTYAVIKGGITNMTRQMASYYGKFNIRVNTLCPGGLEDPVSEYNSVVNSVFDEQYKKQTPIKRRGKAEEIASTALFLASDASSYITGTTIMVDGGWTAV